MNNGSLASSKIDGRKTQKLGVHGISTPIILKRGNMHRMEVASIFGRKDLDVFIVSLL
jgi:hypothetical protein